MAFSAKLRLLWRAHAGQHEILIFFEAFITTRSNKTIESWIEDNLEDPSLREYYQTMMRKYIWGYKAVSNHQYRKGNVAGAGHQDYKYKETEGKAGSGSGIIKNRGQNGAI
jgi:hypothetical protein